MKKSSTIYYYYFFKMWTAEKIHASKCGRSGLKKKKKKMMQWFYFKGIRKITLLKVRKKKPE